MREELRIGNKLRISIYLDTEEAKSDLGEDYSEENEWKTDTVLGICHPDEEYVYWGESDDSDSVFRTEGIPLKTKGWLEKLGFENTDFGYSKNITLDKTVILILSNGFYYPRIKEMGEMSHQETQIVGFNRLEFVHELQNFWFWVSNKEELLK